MTTQSERMYRILSTGPTWPGYDCPRVSIDYGDDDTRHPGTWRIDTPTDCDRVIRAIRARVRHGYHLDYVIIREHWMTVSITKLTSFKCAYTPGRQWCFGGKIHVGKSVGYIRPEHHQGVNTP